MDKLNRDNYIDINYKTRVNTSREAQVYRDYLSYFTASNDEEVDFIIDRFIDNYSTQLLIKCRRDMYKYFKFVDELANKSFAEATLKEFKEKELEDFFIKEELLFGFVRYKFDSDVIEEFNMFFKERLVDASLYKTDIFLQYLKFFMEKYNKIMNYKISDLLRSPDYSVEFILKAPVNCIIGRDKISQSYVMDYIIDKYSPFHTMQWSIKAKQKALLNFDKLIEHYHSLDSNKFNSELNKFLLEYNDFKEIDLKDNTDNCVVLLVFDEYKQVYFCNTGYDTVQHTIDSFCNSILTLDVLINNKSFFINNFHRDDYTRIFICENYYDLHKLCFKFSKEFVLNNLDSIYTRVDLDEWLEERGIKR